MKNTLKAGQFRILIYKGNEGYVGICYETGTVDIWPTIEETKKHLLDGAMATIESVQKGDLNIKALNQKPEIKYRVLFHILPILFATMMAD